MSYQLGPVKPWVRNAAEAIGGWYGISTVYGVGSRSNTSDHPIGLALDFMISDKTRGTLLANFVRAHAAEFGVTYVIWRQHIWSRARNGEGWRLMEDRGDPTANHYDHVHVSFQATAPPGFGNAPSDDDATGSFKVPAPTPVPGDTTTSPTPTTGGTVPVTGGTTPVVSAGGGDGSVFGGSLRDLVVLSAALSAGVVLIAIGAARAAKPTIDRATDQAGEAATLAAQLHPAGRAATGAAAVSKGLAK